MKDLYSKKTMQTPEVDFKSNGELYIGGISTPDNVTEFYVPLFDWVKEFSNENPQSNIHLEMFFDYLNTSSTRVIVEFINLLNKLKDKDFKVSFVWKYEEDDEDMQEFGEELSLVTGAQIEFQSVNED